MNESEFEAQHKLNAARRTRASGAHVQDTGDLSKAGRGLG